MIVVDPDVLDGFRVGLAGRRVVGQHTIPDLQAADGPLPAGRRHRRAGAEAAPARVMPLPASQIRQDKLATVLPNRV